MPSEFISSKKAVPHKGLQPSQTAPSAGDKVFDTGGDGGHFTSKLTVLCSYCVPWVFDSVRPSIGQKGGPRQLRKVHWEIVLPQAQWRDVFALS